jgi:hypothetical protein
MSARLETYVNGKRTLDLWKNPMDAHGIPP